MPEPEHEVLRELPTSEEGGMIVAFVEVLWGFQLGSGTVEGHPASIIGHREYGGVMIPEPIPGMVERVGWVHTALLGLYTLAEVLANEPRSPIERELRPVATEIFEAADIDPAEVRQVIFDVIRTTAVLFHGEGAVDDATARFFRRMN